MILALNEADRIVTRRHVTEPDVARQDAEERNSVSNEHGHASDDETSGYLKSSVTLGLERRAGSSTT